MTTVTVRVVRDRKPDENGTRPERALNRIADVDYAYGTIRADYYGGPYIELTFADGAPRYVPSNPTEVINVWDYETGRAEIGDNAAAVRAAVLAWAASYVADVDSGDYWADWFTGYLLNA